MACPGAVVACLHDVDAFGASRKLIKHGACSGALGYTRCGY